MLHKIEKILIILVIQILIKQRDSRVRSRIGLDRYLTFMNFTDDSERYFNVQVRSKMFQFNLKNINYP